jgi:hypothetical protein
MRLMAVLILLLLTVGCSCGDELPTPTVQPQPVVEQPTYQGETQYDYKAGAPDVLTNPEKPIDTTDRDLAPITPQPATVTTSSTSSSGGWQPYYYYPPTPPAPIIIINGTITITIN